MRCQFGFAAADYIDDFLLTYVSEYTVSLSDFPSGSSQVGALNRYVLSMCYQIMIAGGLCVSGPREGLRNRSGAEYVWDGVNGRGRSDGLFLETRS